MAMDFKALLFIITTHFVFFSASAFAQTDEGNDVMMNEAMAELSAAALSSGKVESKLGPFTSDGCTLPDSLSEQKYRECCVKHDIAYWIGGTIADKTRSDVALVNCIRSKGADEFTAGAWQLMLSNFGLEHWGTDWNPKRDNKPLTDKEWKQVKDLLGRRKHLIPILQNYEKDETCPFKLSDFLREKSRLRNPNQVTCYNLVKSNPNDKTDYVLIYSDECKKGYFVQEVKKGSSAIALGDLHGYGICADKLKKREKEVPLPSVQYEYVEPARRSRDPARGVR
jgi:hypothetical protein